MTHDLCTIVVPLGPWEFATERIEIIRDPDLPTIPTHTSLEAVVMALRITPCTQGPRFSRHFQCQVLAPISQKRQLATITSLDHLPTHLGYDTRRSAQTTFLVPTFTALIQCWEEPFAAVNEAHQRTLSVDAARLAVSMKICKRLLDQEIMQ